MEAFPALAGATRPRSTRQGETNPCTGIRLRVRPDTAAVGFDDCAGQIKSQPCPLGMLNSFCRTKKTVEDVRQIPRVDARTFIAYADDNLLGMHASADPDLSLGRVLEGIGNKMAELIVSVLNGDE